MELVEIAAETATAIWINDNGQDTKAVFPRLATVLGGKGSWGTTMFKNLVHVEFPRLREVRSGSSVTFSNNLIPELHLPRLESVNASLFIGENSVLNDVGLPRLTYAKDLTVRQNPRLLNFTADVARRIDQVFLEGNFTNAEFFSLREVTGDFKVIGAPSMDCSWFDQNFFQKIVKGSYQCVGNHTTPDVPRRPSTSTDLGKLNDDAEGVATSNGGLSTEGKAKS